MPATIRHIPTGYLITAGPLSWQKYTLGAALDFCRLLGYKPTLEV